MHTQLTVSGLKFSISLFFTNLQIRDLNEDEWTAEWFRSQLVEQLQWMVRECFVVMDVILKLSNKYMLDTNCLSKKRA